MGNDWGEIEKGGRPKWGLVFFLCGLLIVITCLVGCTANQGQIPRSVTSPDWPKQTVSSPSQTEGVPSSRPERKPHNPVSAGLVIYVVDKDISPVWNLRTALAGWKKAKWTDFRLVEACPVSQPCVTIKEKKSLTSTEAAETLFGYRVDDIVINLNPVLIWEPFNAQSTLAHELGHTLGAPHITGTNNTLMTAKDAYYRIVPSALDLQIVDALGPWSLEKMYVESGKTVDVRTQPK